MGIIEFLKNLFFKRKDDQMSYEEIQSQRSSIKTEIKESLKDLKFTDMEIKEVLIIVDQAENKIELLKAKLIGSNIGPEYPGKFIDYIHSQIEKTTQQMKIDLKSKVQEIMARKKPAG